MDLLIHAHSKDCAIEILEKLNTKEDGGTYCRIAWWNIVGKSPFPIGATETVKIDLKEWKPLAKWP